jgi:tetratricopeptide (TPR) repeat protein
VHPLFDTPLIRAYMWWVTTQFIGRQRELEAIGGLLAGPARLVSLVGPGGVGKTRLAREYAQRTALPATFVDLSACRGALGLSATAAAALGLGTLANVEPAGAVGAALARRGPCLLILDNVEQIIDEAARAVGLWLDAAPATRILVTSRETLRIAPEHPLGVEPLAEDGLALLVARVQTLDPDFPDDPETLAGLRDIASQLDGLPLALELAAARLPALGVVGLQHRLADSLKVLRSRDRDRPERHRTLRATMAWTWDDLPDELRRALAAVTAFSGPFRVVDAEGVGVELDLIVDLADRSLVSAAPGSRKDPQGDGSDHYVVLRHVREFVQEITPPKDLAAHTAAHARHFARLAEDSLEGVDWTTPRRLTPVLAAGYRGTVEAAVQGVASAIGPALTILRAWNPFIAQEGSVEEFVTLAMPLLVHTDRDEHFDGALATACALRIASRMEAAEAALDRATESATTPSRRAWLADERARILWTAERNAESLPHAHAALAAFEADGDKLAAAFVRRLLATLAHEDGQFEDAETMERDCIRTFREHGAINMQMIAQSNLAWACLHQGRHAESRALWMEALPAFAALGNRRGEGHVAMALGRLEATVGRVQAALPHLWHARELAVRGGDPVGEMRSNNYLGKVHLLAGNYAEAREILGEGEALARALGQFNPAHTTGLDRALLEWLSGDTGAAAGHLRRLAAEQTQALNEDLFIPPIALWIAAIDAKPLQHPWTSEVPFAAATRAVLVAIAKIRAGASHAAGEAVAAAAPVVHDSLQLRLLLRVLWRELPRAERIPTFSAVEGSLVGPDGTLARFKQPVDLAAKPKLARLVELLAKARLYDRHVNLDAIREAGWPGESILPDAARNRVFQLLNRLKKLGARIESNPNGYKLAGRVTRVPDCVDLGK